MPERRVPVDASFARARKRRRSRRRVLKITAIATAIVVALGGLIYLVGFSPLIVTKKVTVEGTDALSPEEIEQVAAAPMNVPLVRVRTEAIAARVQNLPVVREAEVDVVWPDTVRIRVVERQPVFIVRTDDVDRYVDDQGVAYTTVEGDPEPDLIVVDAALGDSRVLSDVVTVVQSLSPELRAEVETITAESPDGITLNLREKRTVEWGSAADSELKSQVATALIRTPATWINVTAPGHPSTR
ncbi:cell division protein FtsQ/DivIB [Parenemella sanctibonifatiensis]|uniref:Cell division protein FtsQ n=1 Tax=Parenemella sanctibonifatiensis TaxID=2016505 RepID=A0A255EE66_9ACTN|nr:FtsQ-type POTRA domain-containing protein [Parenemella sanctibonifatiensis]OYN89836.1 cell division protein FtsQ [Parenemella sanctibonifatiensis]